MPTNQPQRSTADSSDRLVVPIDAKQAAEALRNGPTGALVVASISVALLFLGWLIFYFVLFIPRGKIGSRHAADRYQRTDASDRAGAEAR